MACRNHAHNLFVPPPADKKLPGIFSIGRWRPCMAWTHRISCPSSKLPVGALTPFSICNRIAKLQSISGIHGKPYVEWNGAGPRRATDWQGYCPHGVWLVHTMAVSKFHL